MVAYTSFLLLAALCLGTASSLQCYTCIMPSSSSQCTTTATCASGQNYCQTVSASVAGVSVTGSLKSCESSCTPGSTNTMGVSGTVSCCQTDLCNGANNIRSGSAVLFLALAAIVTLLSGSLL
ncbi:ly6/PLAUR domain-containing protein 2-like [Gastrophryne carolinensis]